MTVSDRGFRAPGTVHMIAGSLVGAVGAYLFQVVGGRALGPEAFAPISVLWTVFFILATIVLVPLEQYVTREASLGRRVLRTDLGPIAVTTVLAAGIGASFVLVTRDSLFEGALVYAVQLALLMVGYSVLFVGKGILAGHRRFKAVGWILFWESVGRLGAGIAFLWVAAAAPSLGWAMVLAPFVALGTRYWRHDSSAETADPGAVGAAGGFLGAYIGGSAASQLLLAGAPLGVAALGGSPELVSVVFVTWTLYRGPLTLIYALQARILPFLVRMTTDDSGGLRRLAGGVVVGGAVLGVLGFAVGWWIGPEVVALLFGEEFTPDRLAAAFAAAGVVGASTAQIAGQALVAAGRTGRLAAAWASGLTVGLVVLVIASGLDPDRAVGVAFLAGEATAAMSVALLTLGIRRRSVV